MAINLNKFKCPECGSKKIKESFHYKSKSDNNMYSSIVHEIQCGFCFMDIPSDLGERHKNISFETAKEEWKKIYKPEHLKNAAKCSNCNLYYFEIEKKLYLNLDKNRNIFMQKFTQTDSSDLVCRICEPEQFI